MIGKQSIFFPVRRSWYLLAYSVWMSAAPISVELRLTDQRGTPVATAVVGEVYHLETCIKGGPTRNRIVRPVVPGLRQEQIRASYERSQSSWTNGVSTSSISYLVDVVWDAPGEVVLGPVIVDADGTPYHSQKMVVRIVDEGVMVRGPARTGAKHTFAQWEVDKTDPYVGEGVVCRLCLYTNDDIELESSSQFQPKNYDMTIASQARWEQRVRDGVSYRVAVWEGILYPLVSGDIWLPPMLLTYRSQEGQQTFLGFIFAQGGVLEKVRAAAHKLSAKALPPSDKTIAGVGVIKNSAWQTTHTTVRQGEAFTITRTTSGAFNPQQLKLGLPLHDEKIRIYPSGTTVTGTYPNLQVSEAYVVQALQEGPLEIGPETHWFFNPQRALYEGITTAPIMFTVIPGVVASEDVHKGGSSSRMPSDAVKTDRTTTSSAFVSFFLSLLHIFWYQMPLIWFVLLLMLPCFLLFLQVHLHRLAKRMHREYRVWRAQRSLIMVCKSVINSGNGKYLYGAFVSFLKETMSYDESMQVEDATSRWLEQRGVHDKELEAWRRLCAAVKQSSYAPESDSNGVRVTAEQVAAWVPRVGAKAKVTV